MELYGKVDTIIDLIKKGDVASSKMSKFTRLSEVRQRAKDAVDRKTQAFVDNRMFTKIGEIAKSTKDQAKAGSTRDDRRYEDDVD